MVTRRHVFAGGGIGFLALALARLGQSQSAKAAPAYPFAHTDAEWRKLLTPEQYQILRRHGTEPAFTSPLLNEHRAGTFACAGCSRPLFSSKTKYDSGTGWPSFWQPLPNAVDATRDDSYGMARTEISCRGCGGHLGHVFDDGPKPTGLRYCMNGAALKFVPDAA